MTEDMEVTLARLEALATPVGEPKPLFGYEVVATLLKHVRELQKRIGEQRMCVGCGSTQTIEDIRKDHPAALACCPERKMLTLQEWRERADKFEQALIAERQRREEAETERDKFRAYAHEATKALTGLVGGGSEMFSGRIGAGTDREMFKADLPFCVDRIRCRFDAAHEARKGEARERQRREEGGAEIVRLRGIIDKVSDTSWEKTGLATNFVSMHESDPDRDWQAMLELMRYYRAEMEKLRPTEAEKT